MFEFLPRAHAHAPPAIVVARRRLQKTSALLYQHGWAFGTSGNYSIVVGRDPLLLLITASGRDKRRLRKADFVLIDDHGRSLDPNGPRPSAETLLHVVLAQQEGVGAVLHTHSVWNTLLSDLHAPRGALRLAGYEMLKGLAGVTTHATAVELPVFENTQHIPDLAAQLRDHLATHGAAAPPAFLIRGHGLYTWGRDLAEARRHVEILEFLFEVLGRRLQLPTAVDAVGAHRPALASE